MTPMITFINDVIIYFCVGPELFIFMRALSPCFSSTPRRPHKGKKQLSII